MDEKHIQVKIRGLAHILFWHPVKDRDVLARKLRAEAERLKSEKKTR